MAVDLGVTGTLGEASDIWGEEGLGRKAALELNCHPRGSPHDILHSRVGTDWGGQVRSFLREPPPHRPLSRSYLFSFLQINVESRDLGTSQVFL